MPLNLDCVDMPPVLSPHSPGFPLLFREIITPAVLSYPTLTQLFTQTLTLTPTSALTYLSYNYVSVCMYIQRHPRLDASRSLSGNTRIPPLLTYLNPEPIPSLSTLTIFFPGPRPGVPYRPYGRLLAR